MSLRRLHVFESRSAAFKTMTFCKRTSSSNAVKSRRSRSSSRSQRVVEDEAAKLRSELSIRWVVSPRDPERFIHLSQASQVKPCGRRLRVSRLRLRSLDWKFDGARRGFSREAIPRSRTTRRDRAADLSVHFTGGFAHWPSPADGSQRHSTRQ